jgi:anti-sigma B factor antagonist
LVRQLTDAFEYRRQRDKNVVVIRKRVRNPQPEWSNGMEISETKRNGIVILGLKGRLDASNAPTLEETLGAAIDAGERRFVVDGQQLDYIGSAGVQVLLVAAKRLATLDGRIVFAALQSHIEEVFTIAGLWSFFQRYSSTEIAVTALE